MVTWPAGRAVGSIPIGCCCDKLNGRPPRTRLPPTTPTDVAAVFGGVCVSVGVSVCMFVGGGVNIGVCVRDGGGRELGGTRGEESVVAEVRDGEKEGGANGGVEEREGGREELGGRAGENEGGADGGREGEKEGGGGVGEERRDGEKEGGGGGPKGGVTRGD